MRLHAGVMHIWRADLDAVEAQVEQLLYEQERERAARIVREQARRHWAAARGVLRLLLASYLDEHPLALRLAKEPHGKPILDLPSEEQLHFNLSHSGGLAVYALTKMCAVGIDAELLARPPSVRTRSRDSLQAWVRHEAEGKRLGVGARSTSEQTQGDSSTPWIAELDLGANAVGAIALETPPVDFQVYPNHFRSYGSILPADAITSILPNQTFPNSDSAGNSITAGKRSLTKYEPYRRLPEQPL